MRAVNRVVLYRVVPVIIDGQYHNGPPAALVSMPRLVPYLKIMTSKPLRPHEVHSACTPLAALGGDRFGVGDHPPRRAAACLDGGQYLPDRPVHDDVNLRLVAARSRLVCAFAVLFPFTSMQRTWFLPWSSRRNESRSSGRLAITSSLRAGSDSTGLSCTPSFVRSSRVCSACHAAPARTWPIMRLMRTYIAEARAWHGRRGRSPPGGV